jgi:uncharacterized membrane protein YdbT with pleckstrin-like domain
MENPQATENQTNHPQTPQVQNASVIGIGDWVLTLIIMIIPLVNFIMLFVWAFGGGTNPSKANWAKASLIVMLISIVLGIILFGAIAGFVASIF